MNAAAPADRGNGRRAADDALALVADLAQALASSLDLNAALNLALARIIGALGAQGGAVFLLDTATRELVCRACAGPVDIIGLRIPADSGIVGRALASGHCQIVRDAATDPDFTGVIDAVTGVSTRTMLGAPLLTAHGPIGVLQVINKRDGALFDESDRDLLRALAATAALAASNAALTENLLEHARIRRELQLARRMQRSLLPMRRRGGPSSRGSPVPAPCGAGCPGIAGFTRSGARGAGGETRAPRPERPDEATRRERPDVREAA